MALLPNSVGSTAKTSLPWHTILRMHSVCSSLRVLWTKRTKLSREAFKVDKNSLKYMPEKRGWNYSLITVFEPSRKLSNIGCVEKSGIKFQCLTGKRERSLGAIELSQGRKIEGLKNHCISVSTKLNVLLLCRLLHHIYFEFLQPQARFPFFFNFVTWSVVFPGDWILTFFVLFLLERSLDFLVYACCEYFYKLLFYAVSLYSFDSKWTIDHFITSSEGVFGRCIKDMFC